MRTNLFPLSISLLVTVYSNAQSAPSNVISTQGGYSKNNDISLEWTLGETVAATYLSNTIYTQGFNQSFILAKSINKENRSSVYTVFAAPNPVNSTLTVYVKKPTPSAYSVVITDISGLKVLQRYSNLTNETLRINMRHLAAGLYLLQVLDEKTFTVNTTKIIKL